MNHFSHAHSSFTRFPASQEQRGVVLIIALVMLLILTLIGVAGLRDTQLQERMAGGAQDRELALQAAETALREAEKAIDAGSAAAAKTGSNYMDYQNGDAAYVGNLQRTDSGGGAVTEAAYWRDHYDWSGNNSSVATTSLNGLSGQPLYVIERLPDDYSALPGSCNVIDCSVSPPSGATEVTDYIITARGVGATPDAVVILQTHYRDVYVYP